MWWNDLSNLQRVVFVIASSATLLLFLFLILMLFGISDDSSFDGADLDDFDFDLDPYNDEPFVVVSGLKVLTLRGALTFFSIGGWTTFILDPVIGKAWSIIVGILIGAISAVLLALAFKWSLKLESSGNLDYKNAIGKTGSVYLRIPKEKKGTGKVIFVLQERFVEVSAVTDEKEDILVNTLVEVVGLEDETTLIVKRK